MKKNDSIIDWCDSQTFHNRASDLIKPAYSVLDIGCGIRPQQYITPELLICVEPHIEYVEILKKGLQGSNALIIPLDAKQVLRALPDRSVDSIFLIDVIEHMPKEIGIDVIRECERVARQQVVLFTPLGYMPQEIHAGDVDGWNLHGGEWQDHKSGWYPEDFMGWDIIGCKQLHTKDFQGKPINPPYGGFYAVRHITKIANHFNDIYSKEVLGGATGHLDSLRSQFPQFVDQVVYREIEKSNLKCGIQACQRTTELFIELGATKSSEEIFEIANREKEAALLIEARNYNRKLKEFASQFENINAREAEFVRREAWVIEKESQLSNHETNLRALEADVRRREAYVVEKESQLSNHETNLRALEIDLNRRGTVLANSWCAKFYKIFRGN